MAEIDPKLLTKEAMRPQLSSSQLRFTTSDAIKDLPTAPKFHYTTSFFLKPRNGSNYRTVSWILSVKHLMAVVAQADKQFMFLKKRDAVRNSITRVEEIPETTVEFQRDFAFDVVVSPKFEWVKFRVMVGSTLPFGKLFKNYQNGIIIQFQQNGWWAKKVAIEHQGNHYQIGWLKYIHPVFANHDDVISDFKSLFGNITVDIDLNSKYETRNFLVKKTRKKMKPKKPYEFVY